MRICAKSVYSLIFDKFIEFLNEMCAQVFEIGFDDAEKPVNKVGAVDS